MTPGARVAAAIEIIEIWEAGEDGLDRVLTAWARAHRFAGSGDRRAIADLVYDVMRHWRSAAWVAGGEDARARVRGLLLLNGADLEGLFSGEGHAPPVLTPQEQAGGREISAGPRAVRLDYPDWLSADLAEVSDGALEALRARAPLDLRVNTLRTRREAAGSALSSEGIETVPLDVAPYALRVTEGARRVAGSAAYADGLVEIQDAASQAVAAFAGAAPGMVVLDLCAGGGGKTLALGADMQGRGRLLAHDTAAGRLKDLPSRARRAGLAVEQVDSAGLTRLEGHCDLVVVDAPCSGSGAWRRNPDGKWRLDAARLDGLLRTQSALLDQAAGLAGPDGAVVYMTCSILARENEAQIASFLARAPEWRQQETLSLGPLDGGDGFFAAKLVRSGQPKR